MTETEELLRGQITVSSGFFMGLHNDRHLEHEKITKQAFDCVILFDTCYMIITKCILKKKKMYDANLFTCNH